jgi:hypothetical protein
MEQADHIFRLIFQNIFDRLIQSSIGETKANWRVQRRGFLPVGPEVTQHAWRLHVPAGIGAQKHSEMSQCCRPCHFHVRGRSAMLLR